jgi:hypothetical protein
VSTLGYTEPDDMSAGMELKTATERAARVPACMQGHPGGD